MHVLQFSTISALQAMAQLDGERLVEEEEARAHLDPDEHPRVFEFVAGSPARRTLLVGTVLGTDFVDSFLVGGADFIRGGRSLRDVINRIQIMGGMEAAAAQEPWLQSALQLSRSLDFSRLKRRLMFVRHATSEECPTGRCKYVEEGQHRAIAAAWLMSQRNWTHNTSIAYLRGVNRQGCAWGDGFWAVGRPHESLVGVVCSASAILVGYHVFRRLCCPGYRAEGGTKRRQGAGRSGRGDRSEACSRMQSSATRGSHQLRSGSSGPTFGTLAPLDSAPTGK